MARWMWGGVVVLLVALAGAWTWFDRSREGIPGFMWWRATSSAAHGGQTVVVGEGGAVRLYFETYGAGEPLLLIHGGFSAIETMHNQITAFAGQRLVIAADSRAHGRSSPIEGGLHYADMADDMVALLDHLEVERADVFGWSDGGIIALDLAMRFPNRVEKIAVFGTNYHHDGLIDSEVNPLDEGPDSEGMAPVRSLYESLAQDPGRWPIFFEKTITMWTTEPEYTEANLRTIQAPTLVMAGEHDMIEPDHLRALASAIPGARLEILPGDDHFAPMQHADAVNALLAEFFAD
ncbi:MAG: alpha/beta hydrolase [Myxococcales bacterium]|nr:alpha/beta hydrolase [Myxococcales bacterium]